MDRNPESWPPPDNGGAGGDDGGEDGSDDPSPTPDPVIIEKTEDVVDAVELEAC